MTLAIGKLLDRNGDKLLGTAFAVSSSYAFTAFHCIGNSATGEVWRKEVLIEFLIGDPIVGKFEVGSHVEDYAILSFEDSLSESLEPVLLRDKVYPNEPFRAAGYPISVHESDNRDKPDISYIGGLVRAEDTSVFGGAPAIQLYCDEMAAGQSLHGMSGGPVLVGQNPEGAIGLVRWNNPRRDAPELGVGGSFWACPIKFIVEKHSQYVGSVFSEITSPVVPLLPVNYIQRSEYTVIETALLNGQNKYIGITGISGSGKSILGAALAQSKKVQVCFDGGVFWVGTSEKSRDRFADSSPIPYQEQLYQQLKNDSSTRLNVNDWQTALGVLKQKGNQLLANKRCLIVMDDPPSNVDVLAALEIHENVTFLVTTSDPSILYAKGIKTESVFELKGLSVNEAQKLLSAWAETPEDSLPSATTEIARRLDYLPLALAMTGATVKGAREPKLVWEDILDAIKDEDLDDISHFVDKYPLRKLDSVIALAIDRLDEVKHMLYDLAMFPHGWRFQFDQLATIWRDEKDRKIRRLIQKLVGLALFQPIGTTAYVLHNLVRLHIRSLGNHLYQSYRQFAPLMFPTVPLPVLTIVWQDELALRVLIANKVDVDETLPNDFSALHIAAEKGFDEIVRILLHAGAEIDKRGYIGMTALRQAAWYGHLDVVNTLLEYEAFIDAQEDDGSTALHIAAQRGHLEIIRSLLQASATPNLPNEGRKSPLYIAAFHGHTNIASELLKYLPLSEYETDSDESAIRAAAAKGYKDVVAVLINAGAEVNWSSPKFPGTALHLAAQNGHLAVVELLIGSGAALECEGENNFRPLHIAAQEGHMNVVGALISAGANVNAVAHDNYTPLHSAVSAGHTDVAQMLIDASANVNWQLQESLSSPLHHTAFLLDNETAKVLIKAGADVNLKRTDGYSTLHIALLKRFNLVLSNASMRSSFSMAEQGISATSAASVSFRDGLPLIELLLANGADPNLVGPNGNTPLHFAAKNGDFECVKMLLDSGASVVLNNLDGKTPLDLAIEQDDNPFNKLMSRADHRGVTELLQ